MAKKKNTSSDLQGLTRLLTEATLGITDLVEAMHRRVVHPPFLPSTPIQHLITRVAGFTYKNIRWSTRFIGGGLDKALGQLAPVLGSMGNSEESEALRAVLNGVVGDYLEEKENPLQITMQFRYRGAAVPLDRESLEKTYPVLNGKILVLVHGSCMNDRQWTRNGHDHGEALAKELHLTPLYLYYNSGLHVSTNGQQFSALLEQLVLQWPVPVTELVLVAHSMGGLVTRSALHDGQQQQKTWPTYLQKMVFLGTPHHGAPLERAGNYLDVILEAIPYAKPFARLGEIRSAGVTDLRYGNLTDEDWQGYDRFKRSPDRRQTIPLPEQIDCYSIAAVAGKETDPASLRAPGDGLVDVKSALGQHKDPAKELHFKAENTWIAYERSHLDLLDDPAVYARIKAWLAG